MRRTTFVIVGGLVASVSTLILAARSDTPMARTQARPVAGPGAPIEERQAPGLSFRLSEGTPEAPRAERPPSAETVPLGDAETRTLVDRLPAIAAPEVDQLPFAAREASLPPPRPGRTVAGVFPGTSPPEPAPAFSREPLGVVRRAPDGDVPLAPHVSVTFSQPMVAVTSHAEQAKTAPPVTLTPQPEGSWRWIGTRTVVFESEPRLPMATDYTVEVPAGTKSAGGGDLSTAVRWTFATPAPTLIRSHPVDGPTRFDPLFYAEFDQAIDPAAVLRSIRVEAGSGSPRLRLATAEEIDADEAVSRLARQAMAQRWLAFRSDDRLPSGANVTVTVGPGTPSAEGPKTTTKPQAWSFRTFGPLRIREHRCGWGDECRPGMAWSIGFSNPIDAEAFSSDMVRVDPPLAGIEMRVGGTGLTIEGIAKGRTTYRVTVAAGLTDIFGQTLGAEQAVSFNVGAAEPWLTSPSDTFVVLDPAGGPRFSVFSIGLEALNVRMRVVQPGDWAAFQAALANRWRSEDPPSFPGRLAHSATVQVRGGTDEVIETVIDLSPALQTGLGHVILTVDAGKQPARRRLDSVVAWVQSTRIGLDAFADAEGLLVWTSALDTGLPLRDVQMSFLGRPAVGATGPDGTARLPLDERPSAVLVARSGTDVALLPDNPNWYRPDAGWRRDPESDALRWYVFDDRQMYRPGEEVKLKGWIRLVRGGKAGGLAPLGSIARNVTYTVRDSQGNETGSGSAALNAFGGFDTSVTLPATMNLGQSLIEFTSDANGVDERSHVHRLQVQEFRRPEFEVTTMVSEGPHLVGGHATVSVRAAYYAGGGLPDAAVQWRVQSSPGSFTPPNRSDFVFGTWVPWWDPSPARDGDWRSAEFTARTDSSGGHLLRVDFDGVNPPQASNLHVEATIVDVNRQAWTSASDILVHPSALAVGLRSARYFVQRGEPLVVQSIAVDLDGRAVVGRTVRMTSERLEWRQQRGIWTQIALDPQVCTVTSAADPSSCTFTTPEGGAYRITADVSDEQGRVHRTQIRRWVSGGAVPVSRNVEQERVTLVPDREEYRNGDTAEVLVIPPFAPAEALVTLRRAGLVSTERISIAGASHTLKIPIDGNWTPNIHVQVDLVGSAPRAGADGAPDPALPRRPAFAQGSLNLSVPPIDRTLALQVEPRVKALEPGGETVLDLTLRDAGGQPVSGAETAIVVVDEAVLSLTGYRLPDPLSVFYRELSEGVSDHHLREHVVLGQLDREKIAEAGATRQLGMMPMAAPREMMAESVMVGGMGGGPPSPIAVRSDFNALALFAASVPTDAAGRAEIRVKVPDNLTRYRVMAVAVSGATAFGSGESTLTARLPLMVRPSAPRFLNFGDRVELPVVVQNQTDAPMPVAVAVRATNLNLTAGAGRQVSVPANDRVEVRFPATAGRPGTARIQIAAASGRWADASEISLPVWTPATSEAFATYGEIDSGAVALPVTSPPDAIVDFGGLEITTTSTAVQALTDAVLYLVDYPFASAEHLSSRVLAVAALKNVLAAFGAAGLPDPEALSARVTADLDRLTGLQANDGGFAMWRRGEDTWPYVSIHAAHALQRARAGGFAVRDDALERSHDYLRKIESRIPGWYGDDARQTLIAYALYVRRLMGDSDAARARLLIQQAGLRKLPVEAVGWLLAVLSGDNASAADVAAIRTYLGNQVTETAAAAHFAVSYGDGAHLLFESNRRADAIVLDALITDRPTSDLIPKIVTGLMANRTAGRWANTQENAFILLALGRYFDTYERVTPDFVARVWLGDRYAGERVFKGRSTDRFATSVPMKMLVETGSADLVVAKDGPGRLYYRIGVRYAPSALDVAPLDRGFTVERSYEGVDDKADVRRDPDGTWHIRAGARVRTRISLVAPARRYHVALVDPMPAGFESLNPALKTTERIPDDDPQTVAGVGASGLGGPGMPGRWWFWLRPWFDHQNLRDERAEAFAALLWEGVYTYSYVSRATTPGQFVVAPPRAEEMYHPETFGRGATDRVVVATSSFRGPAPGNSPR